MNRNWHYLAASLILHLGVLLVFMFLKVPEPPRLKERRVVINFTREPIKTPSNLRPEGDQAVPGMESQSRPAPGRAILDPDKLPVPGGVNARQAIKPMQVVEREEIGAPRLESQAPVFLPNLEAPPAVPFSEDRLQLELEWVLSLVRKDLDPEDQLSSGGITGPGALEWRDRARKLLRKGTLEFPEVLKDEGREVDVGLRFAVTAVGQVIQVEIVQSSGYVAVDRAVVRAVSDYRFEALPADTQGSDDIDYGLIRFFFRLEHSD